MRRRCFIAIPVPDNTKAVIDTLQGKLKKFDWPIRWEPSNKLHITIRFVGLIKQAELIQVEKVVSHTALQYPVFAININSFVVYPSFEFPRVIGLAIQPNKILLSLYERINSAIAKLEIGELARHSGASHITIGRMAPRRVNFRALTQLSFEHSFSARYVSLIESRLGSASSTYQVINQYPFKKNE